MTPGGGGCWPRTISGASPPASGSPRGWRVFYGGKDPQFYWGNGFFWTKMALFGLVFALELAPMTTFIRVRTARRRGTPPPTFSLPWLRRINSAEVVLVILLAFVAAFMARGVWMF